MHSATALRPFSSALSCGKKIHCRARAGGGWWKYRSHSRNATAAALATTMPPSATRSRVGVPDGRPAPSLDARLGATSPSRTNVVAIAARLRRDQAYVWNNYGYARGCALHSGRGFQEVMRIFTAFPAYGLSARSEVYRAS